MSSSSSSSSWGSKLEKKLSALADAASKESIQALAKWIGFNRKHAPVIATVLLDAFKTMDDNPNRQWLYWQVIHEVLLLEVETPKWDRLLELRVNLGEGCVVPATEALLQAKTLRTDKLPALLQEWDTHNVFGGPTIVSQVRRRLAAKPEDASEMSGSIIPTTTGIDQPKETTTSDISSTKPKIQEQHHVPPLQDAVTKPHMDDPSNTNMDGTTILRKNESETKQQHLSQGQQLSLNDEGKQQGEKSDTTQQQRRGSLTTASVTYDFESKVRCIIMS